MAGGGRGARVEGRGPGWSALRSRGVEGLRKPRAKASPKSPRKPFAQTLPVGFEAEAGAFLELVPGDAVAGLDGLGGEVEELGGAGLGAGLEVEGGEVGAAGEGAVEEGVGDGAVEGGGDDAGVAADDHAPGLLVGVGGALADAGGAVEAGEHAAGGHEDDELLLVEEELGEGVGAAGLGGVGDEGAGGKGAGAAVGDLLGGGAVVGDAGGVHFRRHGDDDGGDAVALEEAAPGPLAEGGAQVDGHGGIVDVAGAHEGDELAGRDGGEGGEVDGLGGLGVPVPEAGDDVAADVPGVEEVEAEEALAVGGPFGLDVGVAAEEGLGQVLEGGEEVDLLGVAVGVLEEGALLAGEGLVEAAGAAGGLGADGPVEVGEGGGAALGADHEGGVGLLDVLVDPLEADVVAAAGGIEDHLGAAEGEAAEVARQRVRPTLRTAALK